MTSNHQQVDKTMPQTNQSSGLAELQVDNYLQIKDFAFMLRPSMSMSRFWHYQQLMLQLQMAIWKLIINAIIQNMFKKNNFSRECPKAAKQLTENGSHLEFLINT